MLRIRLSRTGKRNAPAYRIIVTERRSKRDGDYTDLLGYYNPSNTPVLFELDTDKMINWVNKGAQISEGLQNLLDEQKIKLPAKDKKPAKKKAAPKAKKATKAKSK